MNPVAFERKRSIDRKRQWLFLLAFLLIGLFGSPALSADPIQNAYLNTLIEESLRKNLAETRYWHLLVHYKKSLFGGEESEEDGPDFFNAPTGKHDPRAELIATLKQFFRPLEEVGPDKEHPQCQFPARYRWLKSQLSFDASQLPEQRCERLESWLQDLNSEKITLIFASHYMNNPASMFGHTLLRIDKKRAGPEQKLLNYGVNYSAAIADTNNSLIYIFKGLFGGFRGTFSLFPYYVKVQEYSNLETRDLWEYELSLNEAQRTALLLHLWELGGNYFDYYYFQENCSYHLLSLIEIADPDLRLTEQFLFHVIPGETIKAVTRYETLVSKKVYRPSLLSQMNQKRFQMTKGEEKLFYRVVKEPTLFQTPEFLNMRVPEKALIMDTYLDYAQYQSMKREKTASAVDKETRKILLERSKLDYRRDDPPDPPEFSSPPDQGHESARLWFGIGRNENETFEEISLRPAYHDLLAKDTGYGPNSQILFLETTMRYYNETGAVRLDRFKLIDIISLTPYDPLFAKKSWRLSVGVDTLRDRDCRYCNALKTDYGIGLSYKPTLFSPVLLYALLQVDLEASTKLDRHYRLGGGADAGVLIDLTSDWRLMVSGKYMGFPLGERSNYYQVMVDQRYALSQNIDARLEWRTTSSRLEWTFGVNFYF